MNLSDFKSDNFYQTICLFGLALFLAFTFFTMTRARKTVETGSKAAVEYKILIRKLDALTGRKAEFTGKKPLVEALTIQDKYVNDSLDELQKKKISIPEDVYKCLRTARQAYYQGSYTEAEGDAFEDYMFLLGAFGGLAFMVGAQQWYVNVQRLKDRLLAKQVGDAEKVKEPEAVKVNCPGKV